MDLSPDILTRGERAVLTLRQLYEGYGYRRYRIEKFEPYDLYRENRNFLDEETAITFPDSRGRLMALKPDVTMSIVKSYEAGAVPAMARPLASPSARPCSQPSVRAHLKLFS